MAVSYRGQQCNDRPIQTASVTSSHYKNNANTSDRDKNDNIVTYCGITDRACHNLLVALILAESSLLRE